MRLPRPTVALLAVLAAGGACRAESDRRVVSSDSVQVTDDAGRAVALARPARRVVSLLPSFTELLFAIGAGDLVVGRTTWCDWPPEARRIPSAGDGIPPNVEAVAALSPDIVLLYHAGANRTPAEQLAGLDIPAVLFDLDRLEDLGPAVRRIGTLTGYTATAESLAHSLDRLAAAVPPGQGWSSLVFVVWDNPPVVIGAGSYLDQLAALAGATNVFHDVPAPSAQVSVETIVARDPDYVAVLSDSAEVPDFAGRPEWQTLRAVREGRFLYLPGSLFGRPGPRSGQAVERLRLLLAEGR
jgi:ABC-type Fe3+-hydroxamate transport system substrate-binding protein